MLYAPLLPPQPGGNDVGIKSKRAAFTFNDEQVEKLEELTSGTPPRCCCCGQTIMTAPSRQVVLRNPTTGETRVVDMPPPPRRYRWLTEGHSYRYSAAPGKGRDDLRGQVCRVLTLPRPGSRPANVLVGFGNGEQCVVPAGVLKAAQP